MKIPLVLAYSLILPILDIPWLYIQKTYNPFFKNRSGGRIWAVIPVYLALGYLLTLTSSPKEAFLYGVLVYAVYDFTNLAVLSDYPLSFALLDTLWGGILFTLAYSLISK
jgi:uncharacterized membrane protein